MSDLGWGQSTANKESPITRRFSVTGRVQGVGFRYFVQSTARRLNLSGWVRNCADRSVEAIAQGSLDDIEELERALNRGPAMSLVSGVEVVDCPFDPKIKGFRIRF